MELNTDFTLKVVNTAFIKVLSEEMDYFDAYDTDVNIDNLCKQNSRIKQNFGEFDVSFARQLIENYKYTIPETVLEAYGWEANNVKNSIINKLPEQYKNMIIEKENSIEEEGEM